MLYEALNSIVGLFYNFTLVKMKGPNKLSETETEFTKLNLTDKLVSYENLTQTVTYLVELS